MSVNELHLALLRPPILQILRAAGFHAVRPATFDTLVDLAARYLNRLAHATAAHATLSHNDPVPTVSDVRMALMDAGALYPQISIMEEQARGEEDMRGVTNFLDWIQGDVNREIRRIAGMLPYNDGGFVTEVEADGDREDFLTALKKKHSKTGEESRYQGTVLGKGAEEKQIPIEGGIFESIDAWEAHLRESLNIRDKKKDSMAPPSITMSSASSPLSEI